MTVEQQARQAKQAQVTEYDSRQAGLAHAQPDPKKQQRTILARSARSAVGAVGAARKLQLGAAAVGEQDDRLGLVVVDLDRRDGSAVGAVLACKVCVCVSWAWQKGERVRAM